MNADDAEEVRNLVARTALTQDARDWDAHGACYLDDAHYTHPKGELDGSDAIVDRSRGALSRLDASQHLLGTVHVTIDGDTGEAVSYFHAQHVRAAAEGGTLFIIAGTYRDTVVRTADGWRIAHRRQDYMWRDGNPDVIIRD